jgi:hypothetical protein
LSLHEVEIEKDALEVVIDFNDLSLERGEIELSLGYSDGEIPVHFAALIDDAILQLPKRCEIRAGAMGSSSAVPSSEWTRS